jgi:hypothetical protein
VITVIGQLAISRQAPWWMHHVQRDDPFTASVSRNKRSHGGWYVYKLGSQVGESMVELVGIEPTTSSLRTMGSAAIM